MITKFAYFILFILGIYVFVYLRSFRIVIKITKEHYKGKWTNRGGQIAMTAKIT
jgi:hypothetical protein